MSSSMVSPSRLAGAFEPPGVLRAQPAAGGIALGPRPRCSTHLPVGSARICLDWPSRSNIASEQNSN